MYIDCCKCTFACDVTAILLLMPRYKKGHFYLIHNLEISLEKKKFFHTFHYWWIDQQYVFIYSSSHNLLSVSKEMRFSYSEEILLYRHKLILKQFSFSYITFLIYWYCHKLNVCLLVRTNKKEKWKWFFLNIHQYKE
jgi:hypothetical protein